MSRIHYNDDISLESLVERSDLIVIATKNDQFVKTKKKSIGLIYKPFTFIQHCYKVDEVQYGDTKFLNKNIKVSDAEWETQLKIYKSYVIDKMSRSPVYERYLTSCELDKENKVILFLSHSKKNKFSYRYLFSYESIKKLSEVKTIIKKNKLKLNNESF